MSTSLVLCCFQDWRRGLVSACGISMRGQWRNLPPDLKQLDSVRERQSDHAITFISGTYL